MELFETLCIAVPYNAAPQRNNAVLHSHRMRGLHWAHQTPLSASRPLACPRGALPIPGVPSSRSLPAMLIISTTILTGSSSSASLPAVLSAVVVCVRGNEALHLFVNQMLRFADLHDAICIIKHFQFVLNTSNHKLKESCAAEITLSAAVEDSVE